MRAFDSPNEIFKANSTGVIVIPRGSIYVSVYTTNFGVDFDGMPIPAGGTQYPQIFDRFYNEIIINCNGVNTYVFAIYPQPFS